MCIEDKTFECIDFHELLDCKFTIILKKNVGVLVPRLVRHSLINYLFIFWNCPNFLEFWKMHDLMPKNMKEVLKHNSSLVIVMRIFFHYYDFHCWTYNWLKTINLKGPCCQTSLGTRVVEGIIPCWVSISIIYPLDYLLPLIMHKGWSPYPPWEPSVILHRQGRL